MRNLLPLLLIGSILSAATINVPADYATIQEGIDVAADGDTVQVAAGEYVIYESIDFNRLHDPGNPQSPVVKNITLKGAGADTTIIRMADEPLDNEKKGVVVFEQGETDASVLEGFSITGGQGYQGWMGGGIYCDQTSPKISHCTITGNSCMQFGGGIYCIISDAVITDCTIAENVSGKGGGIYCERSSVLVTNCRIRENTADNHGGGICCDGYLPKFTGCAVTGNVAGGMGGAIYCEGSSASFNKCTVTGNVADMCCGGIYFQEQSSPKITDCILWGNTDVSLFVCSESWCEGANLKVSYSCVESMEVWPGEGNINIDPLFCGWDSQDVQAHNQNELEEVLTGFSIALSEQSPCRGAGRAGVDMGSEQEVCTVTGSSTRLIVLAEGTYQLKVLNLAHRISIIGEGEGKTVIEGTIRGLRTGSTLSHVTVANSVNGGICVGANEKPLISDCTVTGNISSSGGGIYCYHSYPTIVKCKIVNNKAYTEGITTIGGGLYCMEYADPELINCVIIGNYAVIGGGIACYHGSYPIFTNCTIAENRARVGQDILCDYNSDPTLTNCIVWNDDGDSIYLNDAASTLHVSYSTLDLNGVNGVWPGEGTINVPPLFMQPGHWDRNGTSDLSDDVWTSGDYQLKQSSPCIDSGNAEGAPAQDIEGKDRPYGRGFDMGAYELYALAEHDFARGDANNDGRVNLADAIFILEYQLLGKYQPDCLDAVDVNDDGVIETSDAISLLDHLFQRAGPLIAPFPDCGADPTDDALGCVFFTCE